MNKISNTTRIFLLLIIVAALYRIIPGRPLGFAPQIAMALFAGAVVKNRKMSFLFPLLSMFLSDLLFEALYTMKLSNTPGFYEGQWENYLLFVAITMLGWLMNAKQVTGNVIALLAAPTAYFLVSNFLVWTSGGGYGFPKTFDGLMQTYTVGLPFYRGSLYATLFFGALLFGGYYLLHKRPSANEVAEARA